MTSTPFSSWLPGPRVRSTSTSVKEPARPLAAWAAKPGAKGRCAERLRAGAAAGSGRQGELAARRRGGIAGPGGHRRHGPVRPAGRGAGQGRPRPAVQLQHEGAEGHLGQVLEAGRQLPGDGIGADPADQPHGDPVARRLGVDEDPVLVARGGVAAELGADEDVALEGPVRFAQGRGRDLDRSHLRRGRTGDRGRRPLAELGVAAGEEAVGGGGVEPEADRERDPRLPRVGALTFFAAEDVRNRHLGGRPGRRVGRRRVRVDAGRRVVGDVLAVDRLDAGRQRRLERRLGAVGEDISGAFHFLFRGRQEVGRVGVRVGRFGFGVEAGGGRRDERSVAGATVEGQPVLQNQPAGQDPTERKRGNVDRESLVIIAGPVDTRFEEDFVAGEFEAEEGRPARFRFEVVDGHLADTAHRAEGDPEDGDRDEAFADLGFGESARAGRGAALEDGERALLGRLWVDAEADRQVDLDLAHFPDRGFARRFAGDDELGEADLGMAGRVFEELARGIHRALFGSVRHIFFARSRLPAVVDGRFSGGRHRRGGDDVCGARRGGGNEHCDADNGDQAGRRVAGILRSFVFSPCPSGSLVQYPLTGTLPDFNEFV